jgi:hypothetical protein
MSADQDRSLPTVLLRHDLPDGSSHVDWLIGRDPAGQQPLIAFRLAVRLDELQAGQTVAVRQLEDHRPLYLTYEGPISGDRGHVRRLASGRVGKLSREAHRWSLTVDWDASCETREPASLVLRRTGPDEWELEVASS